MRARSNVRLALTTGHQNVQRCTISQLCDRSSGLSADRNRSFVMTRHSVRQRRTYACSPGIIIDSVSASPHTVRFQRLACRGSFVMHDRAIRKYITT
jgi:hypothetical protein